MAKQQPKVTIKKTVTKTVPVQKAKPVPVVKVKQVADSLKKTGKPSDMKRGNELQKKVSSAVSKYNANKPTADSSRFFQDKASNERLKGYPNAHNAAVTAGRNLKTDVGIKSSKAAMQSYDESYNRQANKGKKGYDKNGYPKQ